MNGRFENDRIRGLPANVLSTAHCKPALAYPTQTASHAGWITYGLPRSMRRRGSHLQTKLKDYVQARINLYRMPHDFSLWRRTELFSTEQEDKIINAKNKIWDATVAACPQSRFRPACAQALPALASLFEVARLRLGAGENNPPQIVYIMLFGLGLGGSLLAGFGMAAAAARSWIHLLVFAATLTVTLYAVTDMEYPRLGLIRIENFDHFLVDAHQQMQPRDMLATVGHIIEP